MTAPRVVHLKSWNELKDVPIIDSKSGEVVGPNPCKDISLENREYESCPDAGRFTRQHTL